MMMEGPGAGQWVLPPVGPMVSTAQREASGAGCLGRAQTLAAPGLPWALRPAPAPGLPTQPHSLGHRVAPGGPWCPAAAFGLLPRSSPPPGGWAL